VIVRRKLDKIPDAIGKTLSLFPEDELYRNYKYSAYVTNLNVGMTEVWKLYRMRGDAENRIKELKADFGADSFNLNSFYGTEIALILSMLSYNLMSIFRLFVLQEKTQRTLSTLRFRTFNIGAYFQRIKGELKLVIALVKRRRKWFSSLWNYPFELPLEISTA
jgi:transposase DDE domain